MKYAAQEKKNLLHDFQLTEFKERGKNKPKKDKEMIPIKWKDLEMP